MKKKSLNLNKLLTCCACVEVPPSAGQAPKSWRGPSQHLRQPTPEAVNVSNTSASLQLHPTPPPCALTFGDYLRSGIKHSAAKSTHWLDWLCAHHKPRLRIDQLSIPLPWCNIQR